jgi:hypothetical protein
MRKFWIVTIVLVAVLALATAASASQGGLSSLSGSKAPDSDGGAVFSVKQALPAETAGTFAVQQTEPADSGAVCEGDGTESVGENGNAAAEPNGGGTANFRDGEPDEEAQGYCEADQDQVGPEAEPSVGEPKEKKAKGELELEEIVAE